MAVLSLTLMSATGGATPKGKARGECLTILLGRYQNENETVGPQSTVFSEQDVELNGP